MYPANGPEVRPLRRESRPRAWACNWGNRE